MKLKVKTKKKIASVIRVSGAVLNVGYKGAVLFLLYEILHKLFYISFLLTNTFN